MAQAFDPHLFQRFEVENWQAKAASYHRFFQPIAGRVIEDLLDAAAVGRGDRVLDVGTGPGWVAAAASGRGARALGIDISEEMVAIARAQNPELAFRIGDAQDLDLPSASVEAVVGNFALLHLPRQAQALAGFHRVLVPGGRVAMTVWGPGAESRFQGLFTDAIAAAGASPPQSLPPGPPMVSSDPEYRAQLSRAGFADAAVRTVAFTHRFQSADELWAGMLAASVRTSALITGQEPDTQARIHAEFARLAAAHETPAGLDVPVTVKLVSGRKPSAAAAG